MNRLSSPLLGLALFLILGLNIPVRAETAPWKSFAGRPDEWYRSAEGRRIADNVRSHQSPLGSWPKNLDTSAQHYQGEPDQLKGTFDNSATVGEIRFLARAYRATRDDHDREAVVKGLDHILKAQYDTGGFPQFYPPGRQYHRHITFNDGTMVHLLELLRDAARAPDFAFLDAPRREAAGKAFDAGIRCILRCQIAVKGVPTVWCAQHDERTLEPRPARTFEPGSLSGGESAGILLLLMSLDDPSPEVMRAIRSGARWYESARLTGIRVESRDGDKVVVADPSAPPLWARFYELDTMRPIFSGRDSVIQYDLSRIERERRAGYAWYGNWGREVARKYASWKARWDPDANR